MKDLAGSKELVGTARESVFAGEVPHSWFAVVSIVVVLGDLLAAPVEGKALEMGSLL